MGCGASNDQAAKASSPIAKSPQSDEKEKIPSAQYESKPVSVATTPLPAMAIVNSLSKLASDNSKLAPFISLINTSIEPTRQSTPAALCAVSLSFLINWAKAAPDSYTTADVCYSVVKPITQGAECRLTDTMHPSEIGPPNFFISHR